MVGDGLFFTITDMCQRGLKKRFANWTEINFGSNWIKLECFSFQNEKVFNVSFVSQIYLSEL